MVESKVVLENIETGKKIKVFPIDAKEIISQGLYTRFIHGKSKLESKTKPESTEDEFGEDEFAEDTDLESKINSMVTSDLEKYLKDNSLSVKDFSKMSLSEKRKAVIKAVKESEEVEI